jgi:predicted ArsR family transcriptional regulator
VRGAVVRELRLRPSATLRTLAARTGFDGERVRRAVEELHREGLVTAGQAALRGRPAGRVRLAG